MARRPAILLYPADWLGNVKLAASTFADQGLWLRVMFLFHDSDEYGLLRWELDRIAKAVPCHPNLLRSLVRQEILKGSPSHKSTPEVSFVDSVGTRQLVLPPQPGPCWFSSRMLVDEFKRQRATDNGRKGGNPQLMSSAQLNSPPPERVNHKVNPSLKKKMKMVLHSGNGVGLEGENPRQRALRLALENRK